MARLFGRTIFLTGAPQSSALDWSEVLLQSQSLCSSTKHDQRGVAEFVTPESVRPQWRSLPLTKEHLPTGMTQECHAEWHFSSPSSGDSLFFTPTALSSQLSNATSGDDAVPTSPADEEDSQYYEHSFAIHDATDASVDEVDDTQNDIDETTCSSSLDSTFAVQRDKQAPAVQVSLGMSTIRHLREVPNAMQLRAMEPQTVSVDMVLGIIDITQPRIIVTKRWQRTVELVEMLVGDETRTGFSINIWLCSSTVREGGKAAPDKAEALRSQTLTLRPRDVILARNIALGYFRGKVHGQSLRNGVTTLDLLYRDVVDSEDRGGAFRAKELERSSGTNANVSKVKNVKDWIERFVAKKVRLRRGSGFAGSLPMDTQ